MIYKNHCDTCGGSFYARKDPTTGEFIQTLSYQNHLNTKKHIRGGLLYRMKAKKREMQKAYKAALLAKTAAIRSEREQLLLKLNELEEDIERIHRDYTFTKYLAENKDEPRDESMDNDRRDSCVNGGENFQSISVE